MTKHSKAALIKKILLIFIAIYNSTSSAESDWYRSGASDASSKYSDLNQINKSNLINLKKAWEYKSGFIPSDYDTVQTNPIFSGYGLVITSLDGRLISLDPSNGEKQWEILIPKPAGKRGITYKGGYIYSPSGNGVYKIDAISGNAISVYGNGLSFLPPVITSKSLITADYSDGLSAFDLNTSMKLWHLPLTKDGFTARVWSGFSFDPETNLAFIVTSDTGWWHIDPETKKQRKTGGLCNSVLAVDVESGKIIWQVQEIMMDLWDLDIVGPPVVTEINHGGKKNRVVIAVTKSGNTLIIDRLSGKLLNRYTYNESTIGKSLNIKKPTPFSTNNFSQDNLTNITTEKNSYVAHKTRNANFSRYEEATEDRPIAVFGIHGGAEWPGSAVNKNGEMVVTSNQYPWIIRKYSNVAIVDVAYELSRSLYMEKCSNCHKRNLNGFYINENRGDLFFPSLIGITRKIRRSDFTNIEKFNYDHQTADVQVRKYINFLTTYENDERILVRAAKQISQFFDNQNLNNFFHRIYKENKLYGHSIAMYQLPTVTSKQLDEIYDDLNILDKKISKKNGFNDTSNYQLLLDQDGLPGSKPPWGKITSIDLNTGKTNWTKPFGFERDGKNGNKYEGARNFGGAIITKANLVFATGTTDNYARAFDLNNGAELWSDALPYAGSSPPMTFKYKGCQYIIFNASGGKYVGFGARGDSTVAYKLLSCKGNTTNTN